MYTLQDKSNMTNFIRRILLNPTINFYNPPESELIISDFFKANLLDILAKFEKENLFNNLDNNELLSLFNTTLKSDILHRTREKIKTILYNQIDFSFITKIDKQQQNIDLLADNVFQTLYFFSTKENIRKAFIPVFRIIHNKLLEKYISKLYDQKSYIIDRINKEERFFFNKEEMINFFKTISLFSVLSNITSDNNIENSIKFLNNHISEKNFKIPGCFIILSFPANNKSSRPKNESIITKLLRIFITFGRFYNEKTISDRGALNIEKSFFIHYKRDFAHYNLDADILEHLENLNVD